MDEAMFMGQQTPGPYPSVRLNFYKEKGPIIDFHHSKTDRFRKPQTYLASPASYDPHEKQTKIIMSFGKGNRKTFIDNEIFGQDKLPSPQSYKISDKGVNEVLTQGAFKGYK